MKKKALAASGARRQCQVPGCGLREASAGLEEVREEQRLFWKGQKGSEEVSVAGVVLTQGGWNRGKTDRMACLTDSWGYSRQPSCAIWLPLPRLGPVRPLAYALRPSRDGHTGGTHHALALGAWYWNLNQQSRTRGYREHLQTGHPPGRPSSRITVPLSRSRTRRGEEGGAESAARARRRCAVTRRGVSRGCRQGPPRPS